MATRILAAVCTIALIAAGGCSSSPNDELVGKWKAVTFDGIPIANYGGTPMANTVLEFRSDGTFTSTEPEGTVGGRWTMLNRQFSIALTTMYGHSVGEIKAELQKVAGSNSAAQLSLDQIDGMKGYLSSDGKTVTMIALPGVKAKNSTFSKTGG